MPDKDRCRRAYFTTVIVCWAWGAGWYCVLPAWSASIMQGPGQSKITVEPETVHTRLLPERLDGSIVKVTGLPDAPPDAATTYLSPGTGPAGGVEVKEIAWAASH